MTAPTGVDPASFLREQLEQAAPDLLRQMLTTFVNTLMSAEADPVCGAEYGARSAATAAATSATVTGTGRLTPGPGPWTPRSPSCAPARRSPTGCCSAAAARSGP